MTPFHFSCPVVFIKSSVWRYFTEQKHWQSDTVCAGLAESDWGGEKACAQANSKSQINTHFLTNTHFLACPYSGLRVWAGQTHNRTGCSFAQRLPPSSSSSWRSSQWVSKQRLPVRHVGEVKMESQAVRALTAANRPNIWISPWRLHHQSWWMPHQHLLAGGS